MTLQSVFLIIQMFMKRTYLQIFKNQIVKHLKKNFFVAGEQASLNWEPSYYVKIHK